MPPISSRADGSGRETPSTLPPRQRVLHWLESAIGNGTFRQGDPIPSERALAERLGLARNTVAAALDEAERRRLVVRHNPGARKRFVPTTAPETAISSSAVYVIGAMDPFMNGRPAPRWSDRYLSIDLLSRLSRTGKHVLFLNGESLSESEVDAFFQSPPAGMIVANAVSGHPLAMRTLEHCRRASVPVVVYGNATALQSFDRVYTDHRAGARELTQWLIGRGCRRIVPMLLSAPSTHWARERLAGYAEAMREAGLEPGEPILLNIPDLDRMPAETQFRLARSLALESLIQLRTGGGVDAVECLTDHWAKPVLAAIRLLGLRPNQDILVSGYDHIDCDEDFDAFEPERPLVTVDKHNEKTAEDMADLLVARMAGTLPPAPQCRLHRHEVVTPS